MRLTNPQNFADALGRVAHYVIKDTLSTLQIMRFYPMLLDSSDFMCYTCSIK